jgi:hypothetical protein
VIFKAFKSKSTAETRAALLFRMATSYFPPGLERSAAAISAYCGTGWEAQRPSKGIEFMKTLFYFLVFAPGLLLPNGSHAELIDRGGGLVFDTELNITWLQDANYAKTSGYDDDGRMTWDEAMKFTADLRYFDPVRKVTWSGWRLPTARNRDGSGPEPGYYTRGSELGHMYYNNLSNIGMYDNENKDPIMKTVGAQTTTFQSDDTGKGIARGRIRKERTAQKKPQTRYGLQNKGPFINLMEAEYWTGTEDLHFSPPKDVRYPSNAWDFFMDTGAQFVCDKWDHWYFSWPVRDGDVGIPPDSAGNR